VREVSGHGGDPVADLTRLVTGLDPALQADAVRAALGRASEAPSGARARAVLDTEPVLGAAATRAVVVDRLAAADPALLHVA
jgi:hypothetical protein